MIPSQTTCLHKAGYSATQKVSHTNTKTRYHSLISARHCSSQRAYQREPSKDIGQIQNNQSCCQTDSRESSKNKRLSTQTKQLRIAEQAERSTNRKKERAENIVATILISDHHCASCRSYQRIVSQDLMEKRENTPTCRRKGGTKHDLDQRVSSSTRGGPV